MDITSPILMITGQQLSNWYQMFYLFGCIIVSYQYVSHIYAKSKHEFWLNALFFWLYLSGLSRRQETKLNMINFISIKI